MRVLGPSKNVDATTSRRGLRAVRVHAPALPSAGLQPSASVRDQCINSGTALPLAPSSRPLTLQAQLLHRQRTLGNRAVQKLIRSGLPQPTAKTKPLTQRQLAQADTGPQQRNHAKSPAEATSIPPQGPPIAISSPTRQAPKASHIQTAWYNFDIPFTDYQFDPSLEGIKTAANVVKDAAVAGLEWIVDEIKSLVSSGIDWLSDKWNSIQELASSAFTAAKNSFNSIIDFVKNPLGFLADALMNLDAQALAKAWTRFSGLISAAASGFKTLTEKLLQQINKIWSGIDGFAASLLNRVVSLTQSLLFKRLPDALQKIAFTVIDRLKSLWKSINDGWSRLFNKIKAWFDNALDAIFSFVRRVLSFGINVVIAGIVEFGKIVLFLKDLFSNPRKYVDLLAKRSVQAFDGVESRFAGVVGQYFGSARTEASAPAASTKIHRAPEATAETKKSATWGEIGHGIAETMSKKWAEFKANPMAIVTALLMDMILPVVGNIKDVVQLFKDIKKIVTGPLSAGSLEELWTSLLQILDIPILIYHTVVSILMRTLMLPLIVATFIPHPVVKGVAAAVGLGLLGAFVQAETLNLGQKLLLLKTGATTGAQKDEAYNRIADSLIALAMAVVMIVVILILHFIANVVKGVYNFVKGKLFGIEPAPVEGKGPAPVDDGPASKDGGRGDTKAPKDGLPSEDGQRRIRINDKGKCEICASPCDDIRRRYGSVITPEIEARIKLIEDDVSLSNLQKEEALKPIDQELADLAKSKGAVSPKTDVIRLDSPARIEATTPTRVGDELKWKLFDRVSKAEFSEVDVDVSNPNNPGAPDQYLRPKEATLPNGDKVKLEADFSFTDESLKKNQSVWEDYFKKSLSHYSGSLGDENLANFQAEYGRIRTENPGLSPQEIGDLAIREVSFGKGRIRVGFGDLSVVMSGFEDVVVKMGPYKGLAVQDVPTEVSVWAGRTKP